jgi:hypothetical protein
MCHFQRRCLDFNQTTRVAERDYATIKFARLKSRFELQTSVYSGVHLGKRGVSVALQAARVFSVNWRILCETEIGPDLICSRHKSRNSAAVQAQTGADIEGTTQAVSH